MAEQPLSEESIFLDAIDIESGSDRRAFLDEACGHNERMRAAVEGLLRAHEKSGDLLDMAVSAGGKIDRPRPEPPGTLIGRYRLLELIGEGGFGDVYMAEQQEPRKVALKIIKLGMDTGRSSPASRPSGRPWP